MDHIIQCLGKVSITTNGDWDKNKQYDRLCLVFDNVTLSSYISKQKVPVGIEITNTEYWQLMAKLADSIASDYNNFKSTVLGYINQINKFLKTTRFVVEKESDKDKFTTNDISNGALVYVIETKSNYILDDIQSGTDIKTWRKIDVDENYINTIVDKYFDNGFPPAMLKQINILLDEYFTEGDFREDLIVLLGG